MDLNKAMLIGRLTRDPEVKATPKSGSVTTFSVATSRQWKDDKGQIQKSAEFSNVVVWGKLGETMGKFLQKGKQVYVEGRLQTSEWVGKDGKKRYKTEIVAESVLLLGTKEKEDGPQF